MTGRHLLCHCARERDGERKGGKREKKKEERPRGQVPVYIDENGNMKIQEVEVQDEGRINPDEDLHKWSD